MNIDDRPPRNHEQITALANIVTGTIAGPPISQIISHITRLEQAGLRIRTVKVTPEQLATLKPIYGYTTDPPTLLGYPLQVV